MKVRMSIGHFDNAIEPLALWRLRWFCAGTSSAWDDNVKRKTLAIFLPYDHIDKKKRADYCAFHLFDPIYGV